MTISSLQSLQFSAIYSRTKRDTPPVLVGDNNGAKSSLPTGRFKPIAQLPPVPVETIGHGRFKPIARLPDPIVVAPVKPPVNTQPGGPLTPTFRAPEPEDYPNEAENATRSHIKPPPSPGNGTPQPSAELVGADQGSKSERYYARNEVDPQASVKSAASSSEVVKRKVVFIAPSSLPQQTPKQPPIFLGPPIHLAELPPIDKIQPIQDPIYHIDDPIIRPDKLQPNAYNAYTSGRSGKIEQSISLTPVNELA